MFLPIQPQGRDKGEGGQSPYTDAIRHYGKVVFRLVYSHEGMGFLLVITSLAMPYEFAYGVNVESTGDMKEHKESASPSGRTEGEYRWLQPNDLYRVTRYFVEGDAGYQATLSEEPGERLSSYYFNSLGDSSSRLRQQQTFTSSQDSRIQPNFGSTQATRIHPAFGNSQSTRTQPAFSNSVFKVPVIFRLSVFKNTTGCRSTQSSRNRNQGFSTTQGFQNQRNSQTTGEVIDGGIIDGGFIDGRIINGGIVGENNAFSSINSFSQGRDRSQSENSIGSGSLAQY
ncbi:uncharacterized protein LOC119583859 [Penaeus monodon]|uniref:uncharacterized protein LOC119583859 n=1 Tax=Penaeus monodon TaxID=6687 RepID=UPI0018A7622A|nr:uncharacterized protein LOC119583859 [Penaeus monodon]